MSESVVESRQINDRQRNINHMRLNGCVRVRVCVRARVLGRGMGLNAHSIDQRNAEKARVKCIVFPGSVMIKKSGKFPIGIDMDSTRISSWSIIAKVGREYTCVVSTFNRQ
jgi:hypothetical protein